MAYNPLYQNPYGIWEVKNHRVDRSDEHVGFYLGYIDEIAFTLADITDTYLIFCKLDVKELVPCTSSVEVNIKLDPNYTPYLQNHILHQEMQDILQGRPGISIHMSPKYSSVVKLTHKESQDKLIKSALEKLTDEEKKALGLDIETK